MNLGIVDQRSPRNAGRFARPASFVVALALGLSSPAVAASNEAASAHLGASAIAQFYDARGGTPVWLAAGQADPANRLIEILSQADLDGVDPARFNLDQLRDAVRQADDGSRADVVRADRLLSEAFLTYVSDLRRNSSSEWAFLDPEAAPRAPEPAQLLLQAATTGSMDAFLSVMPWMHDSYAGLRRALAEAEADGDSLLAARLRLNLARARGLPAGGRYVLVNTAAQRLDMIEDGRVVDSMRVVVGKPAQPTPMMAALIRFTAINPYWNVPDDLVGERIAPNVVKQGLNYLHQQGYVVMSDWSDRAVPVDPATVDWAAVEAGRVTVRVRQNPGPQNSMGQMKFMFPNKHGVYLHDTPNKELLGQDARLFSAGCVRLEDAPRLARWLYGRALEVPAGGEPEQRVDLDRPVPVYLAYLTAVPSEGKMVFYDDIYGHDRARMAAADVSRVPIH